MKSVGWWRTRSIPGVGRPSLEQYTGQPLVCPAAGAPATQLGVRKRVRPRSPASDTRLQRSEVSRTRRELRDCGISARRTFTVVPTFGALNRLSAQAVELPHTIATNSLPLICLPRYSPVAYHLACGQYAPWEVDAIPRPSSPTLLSRIGAGILGHLRTRCAVSRRSNRPTLPPAATLPDRG